MIRAALAALLSLAAFPAASDFVLRFPVDCDPGRSCHIQHLVDRDPSPGIQDFTCGPLTYDGHKGTDIALPHLTAMTRGVMVRAAAKGTVAGARDGMDDRVFTPESAAEIAGRECGNGVVIRHEDGWETQYCHLQRGSIAVRQGDKVDAGDVLGRIGLSGQTQFPHLHLSVRRNGAQLDPFAPEANRCGSGETSLWDVDPIVTPGGVSYAGFDVAVPEYDAIKAGTAHRSDLSDGAPALVLFGLAYGSRAGDVLRLTIDGPSGTLLDQRVELTKPQAQFFRAAGKRLSSTAWPAGRYFGTVRLLRDGAMIDSRTSMTEIRPD